jgi:hypothetical protein|tara:strand:- start:2977 stop:3201 length:225 start_codon:yes stop_codon:yes gene_type:complete
MYEELNCFEEALKHFGTRVEIICALELGGRLPSEDAYQMIKDEMKELKKCRKHFNKGLDCVDGYGMMDKKPKNK